jgi:hypothetical protein
LLTITSLGTKQYQYDARLLYFWRTAKAVPEPARLYTSQPQRYHTFFSQNEGDRFSERETWDPLINNQKQPWIKISRMDN